jgi:MFS family permease
MPIRHYHPFSRHHAPPKFWLVYVLSILINLQAFLVAYSNSTYLEQFATPEVVGLLYTVGSCLSILAFLFISRVLRKVGNTKFTLGIALVILASLAVMGLSTTAPLIIIFFVVFLVASPLMYMSLDVFSESLIGDNESSTGSRRGLALSLMSLAGASGPFLVALLVGANDENLTRTYLAATAVGTLFIMLVLIHFRHFHDPEYKEVRVMRTLRTFFETPALRTGFLTHLTLQMFFAWTIIYIPLYLASEIGLHWDKIGTILGLGLLAYVVFEWPLGWLADTRWGEKELMASGFLILSVTLAGVSFMTTTSIFPWAALMFINRIGAAMVEVTTESYFFKHTKGTDANLISFFRLTRPLGLIIGSLIGSAALLFLPFNLLFIVLAFALLPGMLLTSTLHDTK